MEERYGPVVLSQREPTGGHANCWWVSRIDLNKQAAKSFLDAEYLRADGTWHNSMDTCDRGHGGTYFKTLEEVIEVLARFEINVISREEAKQQESETF